MWYNIVIKSIVEVSILLLINGDIKSFNDKNYNWVKLENRRIKDLGHGETYEKYLVAQEEVIDLKGKSVFPGFFDSHVHLDETVINDMNIDFGKATDFDYIEKQLNEAKQKRPDKKLIMGFSLHYHTLKERRLPTRRELDKMCPEYPVWIASKDWHQSILNSKALELIKIPFNLNGLNIDENSIITGLLEHEANSYAKNRIMSLYTFEEKCEMIKKYVTEKVIPKGVTTIVAIESSLINHRDDYEKFLKFIKKLPIDIELYYNITDVDEVKARGMNRIGGDIGVDGSFTSRNAALFENYADTNSNGDLYFSQDELNNLVLECYRNSIQIGLHAVGDRAFEQVILAHEYAQGLCKTKNLRHRVEHAELLSDSQIKRTKALGLILSMQPSFETILGNQDGMFYSSYNELYEEALGERHLRTNMFRQIIDEGIMICGGSDSYLTPIDPLLGIHSAVNHPKKDYAITIDEAVRIFTINSAYAVNQEKDKGSIAIGKRADLVVLDKNMEQVQNSKIKDIAIDIVIKNGKAIYVRDGVELK